MLKRIKIIPFLLLFFVASLAIALPNPWQTVETEAYSLQVPSGWKVAPGREMPGPDFTFELQGTLIPATYDKQPTTSTGFIRGVRGATLEEGIRNCIAMNRSHGDKHFSSDSDKVTRFKLSSGEDAAIIKTRWTRMTKNVQQTKYDLVAYSAKKGHAINISIYFAYFDKQYVLEEQAQLDVRMREIFATFKLKS